MDSDTAKTPFERIIELLGAKGDAEALRYLMNLIGARHIALGSDYPFPLGEAEPGGLIQSVDEFDAETQDRLRWGTALEYLGIPASVFST